jgi:hypothetical protein
MNTYKELEDSIVTRLEPLAGPSLEVVPMPQNNAAYKRPTGNKVRITIAAGDSEAMPTTDTRIRSQEVKNVVRVFIQANNLRDTSGIYTIEQAVRFLLVGFKPPNHSRSLMYEKGNFLDPEQENDVWTFVIQFSCIGQIVEVNEGDDILAEALTQVTHISQFGIVVVRDDSIDGGWPGSDFDDTINGGDAGSTWP